MTQPTESQDLIRISRLFTSNRLRVEFTAAAENSFELAPGPATAEDKLLADILKVIPMLMKQDIALAELGDGNLQAAISPADTFAIKRFVSQYHRLITAVDTDTLGLPQQP